MLDHVTFCAFFAFLKQGDKKGQKVTKTDIAVPAKTKYPKGPLPDF